MFIHCIRFMAFLQKQKTTTNIDFLSIYFLTNLSDYCCNDDDVLVKYLILFSNYTHYLLVGV